MIRLKRAGWPLPQNAVDTHMDASMVHRLRRTWLEQGNGAKLKDAGAARVMSAQVDQHIYRQVMADPQVTCISILQHVKDTLNVPVLSRTTSR